MSAGKKYRMFFFLCMFFVLMPFLTGCGVYFLWEQNIRLKSWVYEVLLVLGVISLITGILLRNLVRRSREEYWAEKNRNGKGISYRNMTKEQREEAQREQALRNERNLSSAEYRNLVKKGVKDPEKELESLVGLSEVKKNVLRYKAQIEDKNTYHGNMHMCFLGNPGTGKTTLVAILTAFLYRFHYIKKNEYICVDGNFFKSGEDPIARTNLLLNKARGKVLFIDEAYVLVQGNSGIGQQILATLLNEMENNREELIVILAGYKKEMKELFDANSGLSSRIKNYFLFEDYTVDELVQMFVNLVNAADLVPDAAALETLRGILCRKKQSRNFANGRTVRNLAEKAITEHNYHRMQNQISQEDRYRLLETDIVDEDAIDKYFS